MRHSIYALGLVLLLMLFLAIVPIACNKQYNLPAASSGSQSTPTCSGSNYFGSAVTLGTGFIANNDYAAQYNLVDNASVTAISVYAAATGNVRAALYTDSGGSPTALIAQTNSQACTVGWNNIPLSTTNLTPGTYWIALTSDQQFLIISTYSNTYYAAVSQTSYTTFPSNFSPIICPKCFD